MQIVHLDKQTKMLDSPSIIADPSNSALALALRSIIDTEGSDSADVLEGVNAIINHCSKQQVSSNTAFKTSSHNQKVKMDDILSVSFCRSTKKAGYVLHWHCLPLA